MWTGSIIPKISTKKKIKILNFLLISKLTCVGELIVDRRADTLSEDRHNRHQDLEQPEPERSILFGGDRAQITEDGHDHQLFSAGQRRQQSVQIRGELGRPVDKNRGDEQT